jgi:hypothetical protein
MEAHELQTSPGMDQLGVPGLGTLPTPLNSISLETLSSLRAAVP